MPEKFLVHTPALEDYWRSVILFGRNVASYKFALAKSLLELAGDGKELVTLEDLARPFSRNICEHLRQADRQGTFGANTRFLDTCRQFNKGQVEESHLITVTARLGFNNVIDAFHTVGGGEIDHRFFEDERHIGRGAIRIREEVQQLLSGSHADSLPTEVEARWRLVETAWGLQVPVASITLSYDQEREDLRIPRERESITGCRGALNGYQRGHCFYCESSVSTETGAVNLADVDHLIPHVLREELAPRDINGVWNLVLSCKDCNRGPDGKFDRLPALDYLKKLHNRNEFLISSHHPLRETIMNQTGRSEADRHSFLENAWNDANRLRPTTTHWTPEGGGRRIT